MKTLFLTFVALIIGLTTFSQTPTSFNYQAVLRDASGGILANQQVEIGVTLLQGSVTGTEIFTETHSVTTNNFGLANLQIGSVNTTGMENIDWSSGSYFIQISVDGVIMGTSQLLSVPYALHAKTVENDKVEDADADPGNELQVLSISNDTIYLSNGGKVKLPAETDPAFTNWDKSSGISITESQISDLDHFSGNDISGNETAFDGWDKDVSDDFTTTDETDPVFSSSLAAAITAADTAQWAKDNDPQNELQRLDLENQLLSISNGNTIDLSEAYYIADSSATNELQDISLNGTQLSISKGSSVDLASLQDGTGTDNQTISLDGNQLVISNGNRIYLPYIRTEGDSNPHNEIQTLSIANDTIFLSRDGGKVKLPAETDPAFTNWDKSTGIEITESQITDLKHFTGDSINGNETAFDGWDKDASDDFDGQYSSLSGAPQNVSAFTNDAAYITSADDADADPTNELQVLSISNDTIYLSDGGKVKLPAETDPIFVADSSSIKTSIRTNMQAVKDTASKIRADMPTVKTYSVGDFAQGGIVFYVDETGQHGLACAIVDQDGGKGIRWGSTSDTEAHGNGIYAGEMNTMLIIANRGSDASTYAAGVCAHYTVTQNSIIYGDWYLPSVHELYLMYTNRYKINATAIANSGSKFNTDDYYWSSTEYNSNSAWIHDFGLDRRNYFNKGYLNRVRAVRAF